MESAFLDICSGRRRGAGAAFLRGALRVAEIPYSAGMGLRNSLYDLAILKATPLPHPTISVGNITTGGTGKTPIVSWLTASLSAVGRHPAILLRGYKGTDEQTVLATANPHCVVVANPDRVAGAKLAQNQDSQIDLFILDDAMQHRRVKRNLEIVVINAREPWGYGHVLPRGLLREPLSGLKRAGAFVITHFSEIAPASLKKIETTIRKHSAAPIFNSDHLLTGLDSANGSARVPMSALANKKYFVACGIGSPESFISLLSNFGGQLAGKRFFVDHHPFSDSDAVALKRDAEACGAEWVIVTQKDWAKLRVFDAAQSFVTAALEIRFAGGHAQKLLELVLQRIKP
jgi:tetraacyldisaccharide 4'-kinase